VNTTKLSGALLFHQFLDRGPKSDKCLVRVVASTYSLIKCSGFKEIALLPEQVKVRTFAHVLPGTPSLDT
jgi:hypothetical protein